MSLTPEFKAQNVYLMAVPVERTPGVIDWVVRHDGDQHNRKMCVSNWPEALIVLKGNPQPDDLEAFKQQIYAEVGQEGNQRLPVVAGGDVETKSAELLKLREMQFLSLLRFAIALKAAAFRMHPGTINFAPDMGRERPILATETQEEHVAMAQEEGFHSILANNAEWITAELVEPFYDDLEMVYDVQDRPTPQQQIELDSAEAKTFKLVDEMLQTRQRPARCRTWLSSPQRQSVGFPQRQRTKRQ